jgi:hypothetical protein
VYILSGRRVSCQYQLVYGQVLESIPELTPDGGPGERMIRGIAMHHGQRTQGETSRCY